MKKLLSLIGMLGLVTPAMSTLIACGPGRTNGNSNPTVPTYDDEHIVIDLNYFGNDATDKELIREITEWIWKIDNTAQYGLDFTVSEILRNKSNQILSQSLFATRINNSRVVRRNYVVSLIKNVDSYLEQFFNVVGSNETIANKAKQDVINKLSSLTANFVEGVNYEIVNDSIANNGSWWLKILPSSSTTIYTANFTDGYYYDASKVSIADNKLKNLILDIDKTQNRKNEWVQGKIRNFLETNYKNVSHETDYIIEELPVNPTTGEVYIDYFNVTFLDSGGIFEPGTIKLKIYKDFSLMQAKLDMLSGPEAEDAANAKTIIQNEINKWIPEKHSNAYKIVDVPVTEEEAYYGWPNTFKVVFNDDLVGKTTLVYKTKDAVKYKLSKDDFILAGIERDASKGKQAILDSIIQKMKSLAPKAILDRDYYVTGFDEDIETNEIRVSTLKITANPKSRYVAKPMTSYDSPEINLYWNFGSYFYDKYSSESAPYHSITSSRWYKIQDEIEAEIKKHAPTAKLDIDYKLYTPPGTGFPNQRTFEVIDSSWANPRQKIIYARTVSFFLK